MKVKHFVALLSVMVFLFVSVFVGTVSAVSDPVRSSRSSAVLYLSDTAPTIRKEYMEAEFGPLRTIDYDVFLSATEEDVIAMIANGYFVNYNRNNRNIRDYGYVFVEFSRIKMDGMQLQTLFNQIRPNRDNGPTIIFVSAWDANEFHCEEASITFFFDRFYKTHEDPFAHFVGDMLEDYSSLLHCGEGDLEWMLGSMAMVIDPRFIGTDSIHGMTFGMIYEKSPFLQFFISQLYAFLGKESGATPAAMWEYIADRGLKILYRLGDDQYVNILLKNNGVVDAANAATCTDYDELTNTYELSYVFAVTYWEMEPGFKADVRFLQQDAREGRGNLEEFFPIYVLEVQRVPDTNSDYTCRQSFDMAAEHGRQLDGDEIEAFGTLRELLEGE